VEHLHRQLDGRLNVDVGVVGKAEVVADRRSTLAMMSSSTWAFTPT
jgi:hypothetical protein